MSMNYREAFGYINSFTNYEETPGIRYTQEMNNLTRVDLLMRVLGTPQAGFRSIVVAGSKGKGSTAAMLESILREAGLNTGLYTSPHLHTFRERIRVKGEMIPPEAMARIVDERIRPAVDKIRALETPSLMPTTYELATAIAFIHFQESGVDIAVLEVGLGGRLDAVNITEPLVSIITSISMDHTQVLGDTLAKIAEEKAGIIKRGGSVVTVPQDQEAMQVIQRVAQGQRAKLEVVTNNVYVSTHHLPEVVSNAEGIPIYQVFTLAYEEPGEKRRTSRLRVQLPLLGNHQQINAATALAAVRELREQGIDVPREAITVGFEKVQWPGRLEVVRRNPVVVVDGAHNVDSMAKLSQSMYDLFYGHKLIVVLGLSADKDIKGIISELGAGPGNVIGPKVEKLIITRSRHPRAAYPSEVAAVAQERGLYVEVRESVPEALATATGIAKAGSEGRESDPVVLVTGSLFIVAEARQYYGLGHADENEAEARRP
jgi:dihydrofolate synthase / folylpolyglutamate synthase